MSKISTPHHYLVDTSLLLLPTNSAMLITLLWRHRLWTVSGRALPRLDSQGIFIYQIPPSGNCMWCPPLSEFLYKRILTLVYLRKWYEQFPNAGISQFVVCNSVTAKQKFPLICNCFTPATQYCLFLYNKHEDSSLTFHPCWQSFGMWTGQSHCRTSPCLPQHHLLWWRGPGHCWLRLVVWRRSPC